MDMNLKTKWSNDAAKHLLGKTIINVGYLDEDSCKGMGWNKSPLVIELDDRTKIFAAADDEGNEAGSLFTTIPDLSIVPTI